MPDEIIFHRRALARAAAARESPVLVAPVHLSNSIRVHVSPTLGVISTISKVNPSLAATFVIKSTSSPSHPRLLLGPLKKKATRHCP